MVQRALLTETERANIAGKNGDQRKYESVSRVRSRIDNQLREDIQHLAEHNEDLLEDIRDVVCQHAAELDREDWPDTEAGRRSRTSDTDNNDETEE